MVFPYQFAVNKRCCDLNLRLLHFKYVLVALDEFALPIFFLGCCMEPDLIEKYLFQALKGV